jgi:tetratricopeptide (TPR) repeat protein
MTPQRSIPSVAELEAKAGRKRLMRGLAVLILAGSALISIGYVGYRWGIKPWRARALMNAAWTHLEANEPVQAWNLARSAYFLTPESRSISIRIAQIADKVDVHSAFSYWSRAAELSDNDLESLKGLANAAFNSGNKDWLVSNLERMIQQAPNDPDLQLLGLRWLAAQGNLEGSIKGLSDFIAQYAENEEALFLYVQLTQFSQDSVVRSAGILKLLETAQRLDTMGLRALRSCCEIPGLTPTQVRDVTRQLRDHPMGGKQGQLLALGLEMRQGTIDGDSIATRLKALFALHYDNDLVECAQWMNAHHLYGLTLQWVDNERALRRKDLFLARMDALAVLNRWEEINTALQQPKIPLEDTFKHLFQMRAYKEGGQDRLAQLQWQRTLLEAGKDPEILMFLLRYTQKLGLYEATVQTLQELTRIPSTMRQGYLSWIELEQTQGHTLALLHVYREMRRYYPAELPIENDILYLQLLVRESEAAALEASLQLVDKAPTMLAYQMTLAFAYLRSGAKEKALEVMRPLTSIDWDAVISRYRIIAALVYHANGFESEACALIRGLSLNYLLPEELDLHASIHLGK